MDNNQQSIIDNIYLKLIKQEDFNNLKLLRTLESYVKFSDSDINGLKLLILDNNDYNNIEFKTLSDNNQILRQTKDFGEDEVITTTDCIIQGLEYKYIVSAEKNGDFFIPFARKIEGTTENINRLINYFEKIIEKEKELKDINI